MGTSHSPNLQSWSLAIRLFNVLSHPLVGGVLPLCRYEVGMFYSPSQLGCACVCNCIFLSFRLHHRAFHNLVLSLFLSRENSSEKSERLSEKSIHNIDSDDSSNICKNLEATLLFVDFSKTFDSQHRGKIGQIILAHSFLTETVISIMALYKNTKEIVYSHKGDIDLFLWPCL